MRYLIDSNWVIDSLLDVQEAVELLDTLATDGFAVSILTYMETYQGTLRASDCGFPASIRAIFRHCAGAAVLTGGRAAVRAATPNVAAAG